MDSQRSFIVILRVASDFKAKSIFRLFLYLWQSLPLLNFFFFLLFHFLFLFFFLINFLDFFWFQLLFFFLLLHFVIKLYFVFFTINNVFLLHFVFCDKNLFNFLKKLSLNLGNSFFNSTARTSEFFTAFFRKLFWINVENSQTRDCCNMFVFTSAFGVDHNIFVFYGFLFFFLLWGFLFFGFFDLFFYVGNIFFFELRMIFSNFCWSEFIQDFDTKIGVFSIFTEFEREAACWDLMKGLPGQ